MNGEKRFASCPASLYQGSGANLVAWRHDPSWAAHPDSNAAGRYQLVPVEDADNDCFPVYRQHPGTTAAVATGRLFLRLQDGLRIDTFVSRLASLGLGVDEALDWAPNAAWISSPGGDPCLALNLLRELDRLDAVAHVEAQLAMELHRR